MANTPTYKQQEWRVKELEGKNFELQQVAKGLHESHDYLEKLFYYANAPIIVWDPESVITRFNRAFEHLTGLRANEVIGQKL
jgi:PAS domain-containing protein